MKPQNEKSLFHFLLDVMDQAANGKMDYEKVHAICEASKEAQKCLDREIKRADLMLKLVDYDRNYGRRIEIRNLDAIGFDDTTIDSQTGIRRNMMDDCSTFQSQDHDEHLEGR